MKLRESERRIKNIIRKNDCSWVWPTFDTRDLFALEFFIVYRKYRHTYEKPTHFHLMKCTSEIHYADICSRNRWSSVRTTRREHKVQQQWQVQSRRPLCVLPESFLCVMQRDSAVTLPCNRKWLTNSYSFATECRKLMIRNRIDHNNICAVQ